jgi:hypothetical protein
MDRADPVTGDIAGEIDMRSLVRAILQAIREPSEAMLGACDNIGMEAEAENPNRAALFWQRMIDAALKEGS